MNNTCRPLWSEWAAHSETRVWLCRAKSGFLECVLASLFCSSSSSNYSSKNYNCTSTGRNSNSSGQMLPYNMYLFCWIYVTMSMPHSFLLVETDLSPYNPFGCLLCHVEQFLLVWFFHCVLTSSNWFSPVFLIVFYIGAFIDVRKPMATFPTLESPLHGGISWIRSTGSNTLEVFEPEKPKGPQIRNLRGGSSSLLLPFPLPWQICDLSCLFAKHVQSV